MADQKVNCRVFDLPDGGHHMVFTIDGTDQCVGEARITADDKYLQVIGQLFVQWTTMRRGRLPTAISKILNGGHAANTR